MQAIDLPRALAFPALASLSLLSACGGPAMPADPPPAASAAPAATSAPTAAATAAPDEEPAAEHPAGAEPAADDKRPFAGEDPGKKVQIAGQQAWTIGFRSGWYPLIADLTRAEGTKIAFDHLGEAWTVPGAFARALAAAPGLKKGDVVLFSPPVVKALCARVASVAGAQVTIAYPTHEVLKPVVKQETMATDHVIRLDGSLGFGAPVAYKDPEGGGWAASTLVYQDGKSAWITKNLKLPLSAVRPMDVGKPRRVGDKVLAMTSEWSNDLQPRTISKIVDDGLRYEVKKAEGDPRVVELCAVTTAFE